MSTPKYRLTYIDIRGLGEPIRWIFHFTGTPFIDDRIEWNHHTWFGEHKQKFDSTVGQVPVLYEEGKPELCQSHVISRYLARKFGLTGDDNRQDASLDEIISLVFDLFVAWLVPGMFERDPERKAQNRKTLVSKFTLYYAKFNRTLETSGGPYILGNKLTHADFWLANFISIWDDPMSGDLPIVQPGTPMPSQSDLYLDLTKEFPALRKHKEVVTSIPQIKEWIQKRHQTAI